MRLEWIKPLFVGLFCLTSPFLMSACSKGVSQETQAKNKAYLDKIASDKAFTTDASGIVYKVVTASAEANSPASNATVKVHYEGKLINGHVFDSSYERGAPAVFGLDNLVPAWKIMIPQMKKGEVREIHVPAALGYGDKGAGTSIPPGAVLVFKIELIDFE
jgi:FKBP-type peptidyl-prolyl cis-trans isomerase FklB